MLSIILGIALSYGVGFYMGKDIDVLKKQQQENHELLSKTKKSIYLIGTNTGWGTGFVIQDKHNNNLILTNAHVCMLAVKQQLAIIDVDKQPYISHVIAISKTEDLCLIEAPEGAKPLDFAKGSLRGDTIYAFGYPVTFNLTMSNGYIKDFNEIFQEVVPTEPGYDLCGIGGTNKVQDKEGKIRCIYYGKLIETSIPYGQGGSGSPVVNLDGQVVGIINMVELQTNWATMVSKNSILQFLDNY